MLCFCRITLSTTRCQAVKLSTDTVSTERFNFVRVLAIARLLYKFTGEEINPLFCQISKIRNCLNCFFDCTKIYCPTNSNTNTNAIL